MDVGLDRDRLLAAGLIVVFTSHWQSVWRPDNPGMTNNTCLSEHLGRRIPREWVASGKCFIYGVLRAGSFVF